MAGWGVRRIRRGFTVGTGIGKGLWLKGLRKTLSRLDLKKE